MGVPASERLRELVNDYYHGLLTFESYRAQRARLLDGLDDEPEQGVEAAGGDAALPEPAERTQRKSGEWPIALELGSHAGARAEDAGSSDAARASDDSTSGASIGAVERAARADLGSASGTDAVAADTDARGASRSDASRAPAVAGEADAVERGRAAAAARAEPASREALDVTRREAPQAAARGRFGKTGAIAASLVIVAGAAGVFTLLRSPTAPEDLAAVQAPAEGGAVPSSAADRLLEQFMERNVWSVDALRNLEVTWAGALTDAQREAARGSSAYRRFSDVLRRRLREEEALSAGGSPELDGLVSLAARMEMPYADSLLDDAASRGRAGDESVATRAAAIGAGDAAASADAGGAAGADAGGAAGAAEGDVATSADARVAATAAENRAVTAAEGVAESSVSATGAADGVASPAAERGAAATLQEDAAPSAADDPARAGDAVAGARGDATSAADDRGGDAPSVGEDSGAAAGDDSSRSTGAVADSEDAGRSRESVVATSAAEEGAAEGAGAEGASTSAASPASSTAIASAAGAADDPCTADLLATRRPYCTDVLASGTSGPMLVLIPPGEMVMGSERFSEEGPTRTVTIGAPLAMTVYEISFAELEAYCRAVGARCPENPWGGADYPAVGVSWPEAAAYAEWLSAETGHTYRLPSEAEWEYAARAGTTTPYPFGDVVTPAAARSSANGAVDSPVANTDRTVNRNAFRLYHMIGNVREWVADPWHDDHSGAPTDGSVHAGDASERVVRGGSYADVELQLRSAARTRLGADQRDALTGFRLVREIER